MQVFHSLIERERGFLPAAMTDAHRQAWCYTQHNMATDSTCIWWSGCFARCSSPAEMSKERETDCWDCGKAATW